MRKRHRNNERARIRKAEESEKRKGRKVEGIERFRVIHNIYLGTW